jgi:hypothetical protein
VNPLPEAALINTGSLWLYEPINHSTARTQPYASTHAVPWIPPQLHLPHFLPALQNLNWVNPLRRSVLTIAALINTGSLWLYEGPNAQAPAPLLVARFTNKGMNCEVQAPDVKLIQPRSDTAAGISQCQSLDGGAMRPPGVWDGGVSRGRAAGSMDAQGPKCLGYTGSLGCAAKMPT